SREGSEDVSVSHVAHAAGVNRGTAYQHFQTREQLLKATAEWVGQKLWKSLFADSGLVGEAELDPWHVVEHATRFAMENPQLGRAWLFHVINSASPADDPFFKMYLAQFEKLAKADYVRPGIDAEVHMVMMLAGAFIWPVWAQARARSEKERQQMAQRFSREVLRMSLHGVLIEDKFPGARSQLGPKGKARKR
ncbi:MAG: TetR/AcrR family transcriptional regulator, partial [Gammaproteobacteria bacterium]